MKITINPIRPGSEARLRGPAQRPGWPNSQLTIRNLLLYDAETWWLLVFVLKAHSDQILAKLINQGGCCCSFAIETSQKFWKWKNFLCLKIVEIDMGSQFWVEKNDSGHKNSLFLKLNPFPGVNCRIGWLVPFFWGKFCDIISPKLKELSTSNFASGLLL